MKKQKNNKGKEALMFIVLALAFICSCILATSIVCATQCLSDCGHYDPNAGDYYCGDGKVQGPEVHGTGYGEECDCGGNVTNCNSANCPGTKCYLCQCTPNHEPKDTICNAGNSGYSFEAPGGTFYTCDMFNVDHSKTPFNNFLDYIVDDALDCCEPIHDLVSPDHKSYCALAKSYNHAKVGDCLIEFFREGFYDNYFNPETQSDFPWIHGYYRTEVSGCCEGDISVCLENEGILNECSPKTASHDVPYNEFVLGLTCINDECHFKTWPAYKTATVLNTGTCNDWCILVTTLLRKTGYFEPSVSGLHIAMGEKIYSITVSNHCTNLVWMDEKQKWVSYDYGAKLNFIPSKATCESFQNTPWVFSDSFVSVFPGISPAWKQHIKYMVEGCDKVL